MERHEVEAAICGMAMADVRNLSEAISLGLREEHFVVPAHAHVYAAVTKAWQLNQKADLTTVVRLAGEEYREDVKRVRQAAPLTQNFKPYAEELLSAVRSEQALMAMSDLAKTINLRRPFASFDPIAQGIADLCGLVKLDDQAFVTLNAWDAAKLSEQEAEARIQAFAEGKPTGIPTGFNMLDHTIYGLQPGWMYYIGARPGVGKTSLGLNIALNVARSGYRPAFITVEMSAKDLMDKLVCLAGRVDIGNFLRGDLTDDECDRLAHGYRTVGPLNFKITEFHRAELRYLALEIQRLVRAEGVQVVFVDYVQLFESKDDGKRGKTTRDEVAEISTALKNMALALKVPIIAMSQLNRQTPEYGPPGLGHFADSDKIGRDADVALMLYQMQDEQDPINGPPSYWINLAKQRRGKSMRIPVKARLEFGQFIDAEQ